MGRAAVTQAWWLAPTPRLVTACSATLSSSPIRARTYWESARRPELHFAEWLCKLRRRTSGGCFDEEPLCAAAFCDEEGRAREEEDDEDACPGLEAEAEAAALPRAAGGTTTVAGEATPGTEGSARNASTSAGSSVGWVAT